MNTLKKIAICTIAAMALMATSCNKASAPRTNLRTTADTISYAWGVDVASSGLVEYLEHLGILQSVAEVQHTYDMRLFTTADSLERITIANERRAAIDAVHRSNVPNLNEFIRGMRRGIALGDEMAEETPYATGLNIGMQLSNHIAQTGNMVFGEDATESFNVNQILAAMIKVLRGQETVFSLEEAQEIFQAEMQRAQEAQMALHEEMLRERFAANIAEGETFLAENARREGVVTLPSGLQYEIIREGTGPRPTLTDVVRVHYHGTLLDGTVFDSSMDRQREEPGRDWTAVFPVGNVIAGWIEALQLMPVGSKWKLFVPYDLAYGSQDGGIFGPFSTMVFEVELLGIE